MLVVLFIIYLGIQSIFVFFSKGESNTYLIKTSNKEFKVYEQSYFDDDSYYYFKINADHEFKFQINYDFNKANEVIEDINYYKDKNYECILPIYRKNNIIHDMLCYHDNVITYYYNIKGKNKDLDKFVSSLEIYDINKFIDNTKSEKIENLYIYKDNLISDYFLAVTNYKGINDISANFNSIVYDISLFKKDIYNQKLSTFVNEYYLVADYNHDYEFNRFYLFDLVRLKTYTITSDEKISSDSYIQGVVGNNVYIFDKDHKIQYEINTSKRTIVSYTGNSIKYYNNGNWEIMNINEAMKEKNFINSINDYTNKEYSRIDKVGQDIGYYYLYKKNGNSYDAYRMSIQNKDDLVYLFSTKTIDNIYYINDYVYFINKNMVQVFNEQFGIKNIVKNNELEFNNNFKLYVYEN